MFSSSPDCSGVLAQRNPTKVRHVSEHCAMNIARQQEEEQQRRQGFYGMVVEPGVSGTSQVQQKMNSAMLMRKKTGNGGLNQVFAKHRFDKDILELTMKRNQFFLPYANVTFAMRGSSQIGLNGIECALEPLDGAYSGAVWRFSLELPPSYPFQPPSLRSTTPIFHPNIDSQTGRVSLQLLGKEWSPVLTLQLVVLGLVLLFVEPNMKMVANQEATYLMQHDYKAFLERIRQCQEAAVLQAQQQSDIMCSKRTRSNDLHQARDTKRPFTTSNKLPPSNAARNSRFCQVSATEEQSQENHLRGRENRHEEKPSSQVMLVQKLTYCSLSQNVKRQKTS
mmetsp:Transcript_1171/g.2333  ORF Transcript_1171/g.2333 Transcript_1171/m.2333 type:complete len:336 (-) Transcript_1171:196-1203(-)